jgi:hypothetical protein
VKQSKTAFESFTQERETMNKLEYLKMIQTVITRMAGNSFLIKGWCVTLVSAILALAAKEPNKVFISIAFYPVLMFWILDGYFLYQERLYRALYSYVAEKLETDSEGKSTEVLAELPAPYSMDTTLFKGKVKWSQATFSPTLNLFYLTMFVSIIIIFLIALYWVPKSN